MSSQDHLNTTLGRISLKLPGNIRLITFNINGFRTLFHYHPWNQLRTLNAMFDVLKGDIITLQELKVASKDINNSIGKIDGYSSFLTVPSLKKGYSGVGVYVRIPKDEESDAVKDSLKVIKAEEGLTGVLISHDTKKPYLKSDNSIGGYVDGIDLDLAKKVDSEGRCIILELANNTVVISTYCPANSMGTDEGQEFRVAFFKFLFTRINNLEKMGKNVVLMGDINISRDLIDSAESLEEFHKSGLLKEAKEEDFENVNRQQALAFIKSSIPKTMLNALLKDSLDADLCDGQRIMTDTVRKIQGRKRALYTVWNTIRNSRPGNFGSRIDLILSTQQLTEVCTDSNIWPFLMGSDHCPVYCDFDVGCLKYEKIPYCKMPRLEAKYVYKLSTGDISMMFGRSKKSNTPSPSPIFASRTPSITEEQPMKIQKIEQSKKLLSSKPPQNSISNFFKSNKKPESESKEEPIPFELIEELEKEKKEPISSDGSKISISNGRFTIQSEKIPNCKHNEPCVLKTSRTAKTKGKKFWTCSKDSGSISNTEDKTKFSCGFFQWK